MIRLLDTQLGRNPEEAKSALRFSIGKETTRQEMNRVLEVLPQVVERVRRAATTS